MKWEKFGPGTPSKATEAQRAGLSRSLGQKIAIDTKTQPTDAAIKAVLGQRRKDALRKMKGGKKEGFE